MFRMERRSNANQPSDESAKNQTSQPAASARSAQGEVGAPGQMPVQTSAVPRAMTESESLARDIKEGHLNGFIGNGTSLVGEATFKGMLRVDGHLSGRISSEDGTLIVGTNGQIDANIEVAVAIINGTINGDIIATKRIEIGRAAKLTGNIQTAALVIEQGAIFEGNCRMLHLQKTPDKPYTEEKAAQPPAAQLDESAHPSIVSDVEN
ncbi:MAG: polymer-forming cytoskeletal protein [Pyrinomonadaceae bacterium]